MRRTWIRLAFASVLVLSALAVAAGAVGTGADEAPAASALEDGSAGDAIGVPPGANVTVVATDSNTWLGRESDGPRANAELLAVGRNGTVYYHNDSHTRYWDVDPVPGTATTVEYVYADHLPASECGGESVCTRNGIERVNLTTGEVERVFSRVTPGKHSTRWHDADRIDATRVVVADIARDRVFVVNTTTGLVEWEWSAQSAYPVAESGGPYPSDWTHLNDVEVLPDGRIMASVRNHDQVVFLDRETGMQRNWTLGRDGAHSRLYEQHNPDYIPAAHGGPAVVVADSENGRVVEYSRTDDGWTRTWTWSDERLQWPRDADRLPNGHTLVTDSNGNRVLEVDERGEVVWSVPVAFPYEAERLGTGDESTNGPSAERADLRSAGAPSADSGGNGSVTAGSWAPVPNEWFNAVSYVLPVWMRFGEAFAAALAAASALCWLAVELRWAPYTLRVGAPLRIERER